MKTSATGLRCTGTNHQMLHIIRFAIVCIIALGLSLPALSQTPGLLWSTNLGARVFAVDEQTNVYANAGGTVIKLNAAGVPFQTNAICPIPGIAERDTAGNYYFAGNFDGTQNFGGITLVGGWTNAPVGPGGATGWAAGYPTHYVAKYASTGSLQWVKSFGKQAVALNRLTDLQIANDGVLVGHSAPDQIGLVGSVTRFDDTGILQWSTSLGRGVAVKLGGVTTTNFHYLIIPYLGDYEFAGRLDFNGNKFQFTPTGFLQIFGSSDIQTNARPVVDDGSRLFVAGSSVVNQTLQPIISKFGSDGALVWMTPSNLADQWSLARDAAQSVYCSAANGAFIKYDVDGNQIWSTNLQVETIRMLVDPSGNRFIGLANGAIARLEAEPPPQAPQILVAPQGKTVFTGTNVTLSVSASGTPPLRYLWQLTGVAIQAATNATLTLTSPNNTQSGNYSVIITNLGGAITSSPTLVRIKAVQFFLGSQMLTNGTYNFLTPPNLSILTAYTNGSRFYTLDGSVPTFASTFYTAPFLVSTSATVRALGYSADFSQSEEADPVNIVLPPSFPLSIAPSPGGTVALNPAGGLYLSNTVVTLTVTPTNGWSFLYWSGDAWGATPSVNVIMDAAKSVQAVFGTTLTTTTAGNGQVVVYPGGGTYPYGSTVRLTGVPQAGNYFGVWGNAASGTGNPLYFTLTNPNPTVSSLFVPLSANQAALTVLINGPGTAQVSPAGNVFNTNQSVSITATPLAGQGFINWSGDATGTQNPISVAMTQSRVVTANFTNWPTLVAHQQSLTPQGFEMSVLSGTGLVYLIQGSSNLRTWTNLGAVTNTSGQTVFTDPAATNLPLRYYRGTSWP